MGTLTDLLGLYKPDNGETGWGDEVDGNFDLLESRITGDVTNVKDYGAVGDGTDEDMTGILEAHAVGKDLVFWPPGEYKLPDGDGIPYHGGQRIIGAGPRLTTITTKDAYAFHATSPLSQDNVQIENMTLTLRSGSTSGGALQTYWGSGVVGRKLEGNSVTTCPDPVFDMRNQIFSRLVECAAYGGGGLGYRWWSDGGGGHFNNANTMLHAIGILNEGGGVEIRQGEYFTMRDTFWEDVQNEPTVYFVDGASKMLVDGAYFENNTGDDILVDGCSSIWLKHLSFQYQNASGAINPDARYIETTNSGSLLRVEDMHVTNASSSGISVTIGAGHLGATIGPGNYDAVGTSALEDLGTYTTVFGGSYGFKIGTAHGLGFFGADPVAQPTGVAVSTAAIHAALVDLGLITA